MLLTEDLFTLFSGIDNLQGPRRDRFNTLYFEKRLKRFPEYNPGQQRRRPKPFESAVETCRRLRDLNLVRDKLSELPTAGILGGSVSYGRFYNVCGASVEGKSSDLDLLLVIPDYELLPKLIKPLQSVSGISKKSIKEFETRVHHFDNFRRADGVHIISHKFPLWEDTTDPYLGDFQIPAGYLLSLHVFSQEAFDFLLLKNMPILQPGGKNKKLERSIKDYRNSKPERKDNQRSFSGRDITLELLATKVQGGHISNVRVCHIEDERYYPGLHQNLILPQFEIRWESPTVRVYLPVIGFRWKILERLRDERQMRPYELQNLSLSHTRTDHFSPHVTQRANRGS
jgi:hypothetical protein